MILHASWSWPSFGAGAAALLALEVAALWYAIRQARRNAVPV